MGALAKAQPDPGRAHGRLWSFALVIQILRRQVGLVRRPYRYNTLRRAQRPINAEDDDPSRLSRRKVRVTSIRQKEGIMSEKIAVGQPAPSFTLPRDGGGTVSLAGLKGRKVVLYFYPKDDTSGCTKEAMEFNALRSAFAAADAEIVGVSADSVASHDKFKKKYDLAFTLGSDEEKSMLESYGVWVEKSMYGKSYMGIERTTVLIDAAGKVAQVWNKVKVPGHVDEVLAATKAL
jgi:thioredoxin-dependent peroxiredoxin